MIEFGRFAIPHRKAERGEGRPETFGFLGFTHRCGMSLAPIATVHDSIVRVSPNGCARRLQAIKVQLRSVESPLARSVKVGSLASVVLMRGWLGYHAVPGNMRPDFISSVDELGSPVALARAPPSLVNAFANVGPGTECIVCWHVSTCRNVHESQHPYPRQAFSRPT